MAHYIERCAALYMHLICTAVCVCMRFITIKKLRQGDELVIARTRNHTCLVAITESYMSKTGMSWSDQRYLFLPIQRTKKGKNLKQSGKISCTCQRIV